MYRVLVVGGLIPKGFDGLSFFPFLFVKDKKLLDSKVFMNHEKIHLKQQLEMLLLIFYVWYLLEFVVRWIQCGSRYRAYREISFEKEAYQNEMDLDYLTRRKLFSFIKYL
ncbi:hypothetical protein [Myroides guanonis]|uniref:DUF4157 domain-containing protein n=1 Tax=Myroides guanonis TaxID=1150112 RepID=A0A1I3MEE9_9FLAO|nr:hypothetical protein [Myroides guanonis]SFI95066.1 hypothetical protein SAMN04487893_102126 [Myroides guanonis]